MKALYSTEQVTKFLNVSRCTLHRWIHGKKLSGKLRPPTLRKVGAISVRLWTAADVKRARKYKARFYRKRTGRKQGGRNPGS